MGFGGCTFCNNEAFTPSYCQPSKSITQQIEEGIEFHRRRYRTASRYLAYFQSFSNTYAPLERLRGLYEEALMHPQVVGIVIGTRPDCVDEEKLDYLADLAHGRILQDWSRSLSGEECRTSPIVIVEYGIESCYDNILERINRGHDFETARRAVEMTASRGLDTCRDISDAVWDEFLRQAISEIYQGQQKRVRQVKNECIEIVTNVMTKKINH